MATIRFRLLAPVAILVFAAAALGATIFLWHPPAQADAPIGGAYALVDQAGTPVTDRDSLGKITLVFFGYTHSADIGPTTLFEMSETLDRLGPRAEGVNALFITVDPARDTPEVMRRYLSAFPHIRGLTGSQAAVDAALRAYRIDVRKGSASGGNYTIDHTATVFEMDAAGRYVGALDLAAGPDAAAAALAKRLQ
ncbi:SCO family protein [Labrys wisconsinensis]|uniref:Protein SCO1/2 n=1 Tax=Labrys wisconsinensis TaxID=425677 RepID=A0ABU0JDJ3_9HYPH|nr:SCO family protein [Labrys wisconsinensis]MDQ0472355.1 protein SCO1/2 [Labrys wisconsinensis]